MSIYIWSFKCKKSMKVQNSWIAISNILHSLMDIFPTGDLKYTVTHLWSKFFEILYGILEDVKGDFHIQSVTEAIV